MERQERHCVTTWCLTSANGVTLDVTLPSRMTTMTVTTMTTTRQRHPKRHRPRPALTSIGAAVVTLVTLMTLGRVSLLGPGDGGGHREPGVHLAQYSMHE